MARKRVYQHPRIYTGRPGPSAASGVTGPAQLIVDEAGLLCASVDPGDEVEVVKLPGAAVTPGFIDTHAHLSSLGSGIEDIDLDDVASPDALLDATRAAAARRGPGAWITGTGWRDDPTWAIRTGWADALEAAGGYRPVALFRRDRHALLASRSALRAAGIDAGTADPPGGRIDRDAAGEATGLLVDAAMDLVTAAFPAPSVEDVAAQARQRAEHMAALGVTCVHEAWVSPQLWAALRLLCDSGRLPLRVRALLGPGFDAPPVSPGPDWLRAIGIKGFADGALGSRGAQMRAPYDDAPTRGLAVQSDAELAEAASRARAWGLQLAVHAIGDEAARRVLDLFEAQAGADPPRFYRDHRWRMEHAQTIHPDDLRRVRGLGMAIQPIHFWADAPWADRRLGAARLPWSHRTRSLVEAGAMLGFGSDFPIESANPLAGVMAAAAEVHPGAPHWRRSAECLARAEALDGYWSRAAWLAFDEHRLGRLEAGFLADFVCLDQDPYEAADPSAIRVVQTVVGGRWVPQAPSHPF